ncbi:hypothetical protein [Burkholderia sp. Ac-20365]|jgi:hypothetical protein|uniref:hypothetical protein n=1 Tax=Burkholderia sp. Ac-20365 TaxID=2703897 RepID=UPI00197C52B0|nr:hypothetical protein [Burkholderia sp. Ac-20365]MBN3763406.1 hypothetical protein [Burkholderia sp. Ac-20365]
MHNESVPKQLLEKFGYDERKREHFALLWLASPGTTREALVRFRVEFRLGYAVLTPSRDSE